MRREEVPTNKERPLYYLNWDNEFSVRFNFKESPVVLQHIPNNIFSIELPDISVTDLLEDDVDRTLKLTLRSTSDGLVEKEVFNVLLRNSFDLDLSLKNPNKVVWKYNDCSVEKIGFSPLIDRKSRSNPFNYILYIKVHQAVYNGDDQIIQFGNLDTVKSEVEIESDKESQE